MTQAVVIGWEGGLSDETEQVAGSARGDLSSLTELIPSLPRTGSTGTRPVWCGIPRRRTTWFQGNMASRYRAYPQQEPAAGLN
jgi:hypothetical protein